MSIITYPWISQQIINYISIYKIQFLEYNNVCGWYKKTCDCGCDEHDINDECSYRLFFNVLTKVSKKMYYYNFYNNYQLSLINRFFEVNHNIFTINYHKKDNWYDNLEWTDYIYSDLYANICNYESNAIPNKNTCNYQQLLMFINKFPNSNYHIHILRDKFCQNFYNYLNKYYNFIPLLNILFDFLNTVKHYNNVEVSIYANHLYELFTKINCIDIANFPVDIDANNITFVFLSSFDDNIFIDLIKKLNCKIKYIEHHLHLYC